MSIGECDIRLRDDLKLAIAEVGNDASQVILSRADTTLVEFLITPERSGGLRLEEFQPEAPDPALPAWVVTALEAILPQLDWAYIVGLYPLWWHSELRSFGFKHLRERVRMEIQLPEQYAPRTRSLDSLTIRSLSASAERLGEVLYRSECEAVTLAQCVEYCRFMLEGAFGPVIEDASREAVANKDVVGACVFSEYRGVPLLGHIFVEKSMQQRGLASALLRDCLDALVEAGYKKAILSTDASNESAQQLYRRVGFVPIEPQLTCGYMTKTDWEAQR
jgi:RimJ/RimL family protein N-acetyltransferase